MRLKLLDRMPRAVARYPSGRAFTIPAGDRMYGRVVCFGAWEPDETWVLAHVVAPGDFVLDIGANHGWHALGMAERAGPAGRVWAFEPVPHMLRELHENLDLNDHKAPIEVFPFALGSRRGSVEIFTFDGLPMGHASTSALGRSDARGVRVECMALDEVLGVDADAVDIVKMDVEGSELDILQGAESLTTSATPPIWLLEVNLTTSHAFRYVPSDLLDHLLQRNHYEVYRINRGEVTREHDAANAPHGAGWLLVPPSRRHRVRSLLHRGIRPRRRWRPRWLHSTA